MQTTKTYELACPKLGYGYWLRVGAERKSGGKKTPNDSRIKWSKRKAPLAPDRPNQTPTPPVLTAAAVAAQASRLKCPTSLGQKIGQSMAFKMPLDRILPG